MPLVIRSVVGAGGRFGAIHSQMPISWLMGVTGLKIVAPSTPADAKGLLKASIRDDNPVLFFEHKRLYSAKGPAGDGEDYVLGRAAVVREGSDVTLVSAMKGVHDCLAAADALAEQGISAEVIDLRTRAAARTSRRSCARSRRRTGSPSSRRARGPAAGPARCSRPSPRRRSATSTTPGASPPPTRRSRTAHRSRTRSCPALKGSRPRCCLDHDSRAEGGAMPRKIVDTILPTTMVGSYPRPHWFNQQLLGRDVRVAFKERRRTTRPTTTRRRP